MALNDHLGKLYDQSQENIIDLHSIQFQPAEEYEGFTQDIPEKKEYALSLLSSEGFDKIDLLNLSEKEKKQFIKKTLRLNAEDRKKFIDAVLKTRK